MQKDSRSMAAMRPALNQSLAASVAFACTGGGSSPNWFRWPPKRWA